MLGIFLSLDHRLEVLTRDLQLIPDFERPRSNVVVLNRSQLPFHFLCQIESCQVNVNTSGKRNEKAII